MPTMAPGFLFRIDEFEPRDGPYHQSDLPSPDFDKCEQPPWNSYFDTSDIYDFGYPPVVPAPNLLSRPPQFNMSNCGYICSWGCSYSDMYELENSISIPAPMQVFPTSEGPDVDTVQFIRYRHDVEEACPISQCSRSFSRAYDRARHIKTIPSVNAGRTQEFERPQSLPVWHCSTCTPGQHARQVKPYHTGKGHQPDEESGIVRDVPNYGDCRECINYNFNRGCGCDVSCL
jgi:hypothetical protein